MDQGDKIEININIQPKHKVNDYAVGLSVLRVVTVFSRSFP